MSLTGKACAAAMAGFRRMHAVWFVVGAILGAGWHTASAQQVASRVSPGDCNAFGYYVLQEAREFGSQMSKTFLTAVSRFTLAGCATRDQDGEIQLITETRQDGESLRTARSRMGKIDILGLSGVGHCHRPPGGVCGPSQRTGGR